MAKKKATRKKTKKRRKKRSTNKSQVVRDYIAKHPNAGPTEVANALAKKGTKVAPSLVSRIKSGASPKRKKRVKKKKKARKVGRVRRITEPTVVEDMKQAGDLMLKAVELVVAAGAKEAKHLVSLAEDMVKKVSDGKK